MPYKIDTLKLRLKRKHDRRVKYTQEDKNGVMAMHKEGISQRAIARKTGMSRRYVGFVLFPERAAICRKQFKGRRKDGRYYNKEVNTKAVRSCRRWRKDHIQSGGATLKNNS